jgi:leucyl-tRNA synthetase
LQRLWRLVDGAVGRGLCLADRSTAASDPLPPDLTPGERELRRAVHTAIQEVSADLLGSLQCNTAVSELMKLANAMGSQLEEAGEAVAREALRTLLVLLAPFAPHLAEELWHRLQGGGSVHRQGWPLLDETALRRDTIALVIQVKGKVRGSLEVPADCDAATLERLALSSEIAERWLEGRPPRRVIVVPGKLVNLVP